jgi:hypothetical protein
MRGCTRPPARSRWSASSRGTIFSFDGVKSVIVAKGVLKTRQARSDLSHLITIRFCTIQRVGNVDDALRCEIPVHRFR